MNDKSSSRLRSINRAEQVNTVDYQGRTTGVRKKRQRLRYLCSGGSTYWFDLYLKKTEYGSLEAYIVLKRHSRDKEGRILIGPDVVCFEELREVVTAMKQDLDQIQKCGQRAMLRIGRQRPIVTSKRKTVKAGSHPESPNLI